jgi:hypothetical protein
MAPAPAAQGSPRGRGADILTAEEFGGLVHIGRVRTVTDLCAAGQVPGATKIGHEWRIHWPAFYAAVAGPGIPEGEVVTSGELARYLRVDERVVRRASAAPGTPGKLPGLQVGKRWLYALPAVHAQAGWPLDGGQDAAVPGPPAARPAPAQPASSARIQAGQSLEYPAAAAGQAPAARSPGRGAVARHRRRGPGPGRSPAPR